MGDHCRQNESPGLIIDRFERDFQEVAFLGAGGFGSVLKCRPRYHTTTDVILDEEKEESKIPDVFYAIKRIPLGEDILENQKLLREARTLARVKYKHIVRYYSAWIGVKVQVTEHTRGQPSQHVVNPDTNLLNGETGNPRRDIGGESVSATWLSRIISEDKPMTATSVKDKNCSNLWQGHSKRPPRVVPPATAPKFTSLAGSASQSDMRVASRQIQKSLSRSRLATSIGKLKCSSSSEETSLQEQEEESLDENDGHDGFALRLMPDDIREFLRSQFREEERLKALSSALNDEDSFSSSESLTTSSDLDFSHSFHERNLKQRSAQQKYQDSDGSSSSNDVVFGEDENQSAAVVYEEMSSQPTLLSAIRAHTSSQIPTVSSESCGLPEKKAMAPDSNAVKRFLYIAMEYVEGMTLRTAIVDGHLLNLRDQVWSIFHQMCDGIAYMHSHNLVHRDMKPENVFLKNSEDQREKWFVKIGDLGLSTFIEGANRSSAAIKERHVSNDRNDEFETNAGLSVGVGTQFYIAPEMLSISGRYYQAADIYALGIILFEMLVPPFKTTMERYKVLTKLCESNGQNALELGCPDKESASLIAKMMHPDPSSRPSARLLLLASLRHESDRLMSLDRILASPYSYETFRVLTSLFNRKETSERIKAFWEPYQFATPTESRIITEIKAYFHCLLRSFGAIQVDLPVLIPSSSSRCAFTPTDAYKLLHTSGVRMELPSRLIVLLKETLPAVQLATVIRRFAIDSVTKESIPSIGDEFSESTASKAIYPRTALRLAFDTVVDFGRLNLLDKSWDASSDDQVLREVMLEADPLIVLWTLIQNAQTWLGEVKIVLSYGRLLPLLLHILFNIPEQYTEDLADAVRGPKYSQRLFISLLHEIWTSNKSAVKVAPLHAGQAAKILESWLTFRGDINDLLIRLKEINLPLSTDINSPLLKEFNVMIRKIQAMGTMLRACLDTGASKISIRIDIEYDKCIFNSRTGYFVVCYSDGASVAALTALKKTRFDGGVRFPEEPLRHGGDIQVLAIGGRIDHNSRSLEDPKSSFAFEFDLQGMIDVVLLHAVSHQFNTKKLRNPSVGSSRKMSYRDDTDGEQQHVWNTRHMKSSQAGNEASTSGRKGRWRGSVVDDYPTGNPRTRKTSTCRDELEKYMISGQSASEHPSDDIRNKHDNVTNAGQTLTNDGCPVGPGSNKSTGKDTLVKKFVLLPTSTPIDAVQLTGTVIGLRNLDSHMLRGESQHHDDGKGNYGTRVEDALIQQLEHQQQKLKFHWKAPLEAAVAPALLKRFNPTSHNATQNAKNPNVTMVVIMFEDLEQAAVAYALKVRLGNLKIRSRVHPIPVHNVVKARKKLKSEETCDWLVYLSQLSRPNRMANISSSSIKKDVGFQRNSTAAGDVGGIRLMAVLAASYLSKQTSQKNFQFVHILEESDKVSEQGRPKPQNVLAKRVNFAVV